MTSLRELASCLGLPGRFSLLSDFFGVRRSSIPKDPTGAPLDFSVMRQAERLRGRHIHLNVTAVGADRFDDDDDEVVDYALARLRAIYAPAALGIGRVEHFAVTAAQANGLDAPTQEGQLEEITDRWSVAGDGIDLFVVFSVNVASNGGSILGRSAIEGPCEAKDDKEMNGAVVGLWSKEQTARTLAHELGHYLGLTHRNGEPDNLMAQTSVANSVRLSVTLSQDQADDMLDHCLTKSGC